MQRIELSAFEIAAVWAAVKNARDTRDNARARETQRLLERVTKALLDAEEVSIVCR